ncbi:hypothetical protein Ga0466249_002802 [Sporomusaceae bacterium BoRhaA]|uniref:phage tail protein n=1 Tax=Pelorhabdus rhamnosifermentans TaxID=2772457 RepID=UPI001C063072|nr:phage tail protein [Pelorhabdus rhamnosifermentans]MBU2701683.1 hypothetical protein [Pelorhabdus rhamnosifermentans]
MHRKRHAGSRIGGAANVIEFNASQIERAEQLLGGIKDALPKAQASAINRSLTTARTEIVRSVRKEYVIKAEDVRNTIKVTNASAASPIGSIKSMGGPIPLVKFDTSKENPVRVRVKKSGAKKPIKHAFLQAMGNGYRGIFIRSGKARYPLKQLYGPSVPQMVGNETVMKSVEEKAIQTLDKRMDHEINRILEAGR